MDDKKTFAVVMPPSFEYLESLFLPDLFRARLAGRVALALERLRRHGYGVSFFPGAHGLTADETAKALRAKGVDKVQVFAPFHGETQATVLEEALERPGFKEPSLLLARPEDDQIQRLEMRIEAQAEMDLTTADSVKGESSGFLILEEGEALPGQGVCFRKNEDGFLRETPGPAPGIPARINRIRIVDPEKKIDVVDDEDVMLAMPVGHGDQSLITCRDLIQRHGPDRFRLVQIPPSNAGERMTSFTWGARYGFHDQSSRDFLFNLVSKYIPRWLTLLHTVFGFYELGTDPLEEMYGGNSLIERNPELIENIV